MKKYILPTLLILAILCGCTSVIQNGNRELTIEQVQQFAQQTLTAQAGGSGETGNTGGLVIRPVSTTPAPIVPTSAATSGVTVLNVPTTSAPVYTLPTAIPTATSNYQYIQPTSAYTAPNYAQPVTTVCDRVRFIDDVTIPDDTVLQPGQTFRKTWRIQNGGSCVWNSGYQLVFAGGDVMGQTYAVNLPGTVAPGETIDVSIDLTAPNAYGTYQSNWKLRSASGYIFGTANTENDAIWARIVVGTSSNLATVAPGVTPVNSGCTVLSVVPAYRATFRRGEETDFEFRVRNDSSIMWDTDDMDVAYVSGENMLKRKAQTRRDLPMDVAPGGTLYYALDAIVPDVPGTYTMTMGVVRGYEVLCSMDVTITVVN